MLQYPQYLYALTIYVNSTRILVHSMNINHLPLTGNTVKTVNFQSQLHKSGKKNSSRLWQNPSSHTVTSASKSDYSLVIQFITRCWCLRCRQFSWKTEFTIESRTLPLLLKVSISVLISRSSSSSSWQ